METHTDTLKVFYKHHQHARVQKEREDMWISSEDLRTEGSSDEEAQSSSRSRRLKKNRKQRKSAADSRSTSSLVSNYSETSEIKDVTGCASEVEKSTDEPNIDVSQRFSVMANPLFTDVFPDSAAGTSAISLASSDSGMDALNLESRWRPKRGSLKYPILVEGQTSVNYLHQIDGFFNEMMAKVKSLRSCPVLDDFDFKEPDKDELKPLFKHLKETPVVKEKLEYIAQLDEEIKETIQVYKTERAERLQVQNEMCNDIYKNKTLPERDTRLFLELCQFEANDNSDHEEDDYNESVEEAANAKQRSRNNDHFIKRNIELAREGIMVGCSLTDEEKKKLEELLVDEQDDALDNVTREKKYTYSLEEEDDDSNEEENFLLSNAYLLNDDDKKKLEDINSELEKFTVDETENEKVDSRRKQTEFKDILLMEQRLKAINSKIDELRKSYEAEKENSAATSSEEVSERLESQSTEVEGAEKDKGDAAVVENHGNDEKENMNEV